MTNKAIADTILSGWAFLALFSWVWMLFMAVLLPVVLVSVAVSLRGIRRELGRLNGVSEPSRGGLFPNATERAAPTGHPSLGHQLLK